MNVGNILLWGFAATAVLTTVMAAAKPLGITRMDLPFLLGTIFTSNRNKAPLLGFIVHLLIGWAFAFLYYLSFSSAHIHGCWFGMAIGFLHGAFVLSIGVQLIATFHPR